MRAAVAVLLLCGLAPRAVAGEPPRRFELVYSAAVPRPAGGGAVRLWMPVPRSGAEQDVAPLAVTAPGKHLIATDPATGNAMLHVELAAASLPVTVTWRTTVTRRESRTGALPLTASDRRRRARFLDESALGVVAHPEVDRALAAALARPRTPAPRAIYDHVLASVDYDKTAPGWGRGDTVRACRIGKGNCTDFHALFISMMRRRRIPAEFAVGLSLPASSGAGPLSGYHCWAYFVDRARGWVPVDLSEAWKDPSKTEYYFGALTTNRVELSRGRDVNLAPRQSGPPLNYFVDPYAESAGAPVAVTRAASFRDL